MPGETPQPAESAARPDEQQEAERRSALRANVVHEAVRLEGEEELERASSALAWSGLAAGLSMGLSLVGEGVLRARIPDVPWRPLIAKFGYTVGYLVVILGRQQLFTENTLTVILPLLAQFDLRKLGNVGRLWAIVLASNLAGVMAFAWFISRTEVFAPAVRTAMLAIGREAMSGGSWTIGFRGILAGWMIALIVWLLPAAESARVNVIVIITYLVGIAGLTHVIAGSAEALYLVWNGAASWGEYLGGYMAPTLAGNIVGGVSLVALINHAQVVSGRQKT